jgi:hypothetical protein
MSCHITFPNLGVKLSVFDKFVEECGGLTSLQGLTTADVSEKYIKPFTKDLQISYCEKLKNSNNSGVKKATVFISHAWQFLFLNVVNSIKNHFKHYTNDEVILWFDLFSNNQHHAPELDFTWWSTTFKSAIERLGHTVLILSPWNDPIPLTRVWCLYEIYCK